MNEHHTISGGLLVTIQTKFSVIVFMILKYVLKSRVISLMINKL